MASHSSSSRDSRQRTFEVQAPTEDDYSALSVDGFDDEEDIESELRPQVAAVPGASPASAVSRFYRLYLNSRGFASTAELTWGLGYAVVTTAGMFMLMAWMGVTVERGGDAVSSLFRVLYMLMVVVAPVWLIVHLTPSLSLIRRFRNGRIEEL